MHPSLIAGEDHTEFAFESRNLEFEAILISIKDSDTSLAGLLVGRICINNMSIWCLVGVNFCPFDPDVAFKPIVDFATAYASDSHAYAESIRNNSLYCKFRCYPNKRTNQKSFSSCMIFQLLFLLEDLFILLLSTIYISSIRL